MTLRLKQLARCEGCRLSKPFRSPRRRETKQVEPCQHNQNDALLPV